MIPMPICAYCRQDLHSDIVSIIIKPIGGGRITSCTCMNCYEENKKDFNKDWDIKLPEKK